jgi:hypothetical protein
MKDVNSDWFEQNRNRENAEIGRGCAFLLAVVVVLVALASALASVLS